MDYNREEDILYLAHPLWEESDEPTATPHTYWAQAALQILAQDRKQQHRAECIPECGESKTDFYRHQSYVQPGFAVRIDMGTGVGKQSVTLIKECDYFELANAVRCWGRVAD